MKTLLFALLIVSSVSVNAQITSGKITYETVRSFEFDSERFGSLPPDVQKRIKDRMESMKNTKKVLLFTESASLFRDYNEEKDAESKAEWVETGDQSGNRMRMMMMRPVSQTYVDLAAGTTLLQTDMMQKTFLITDAAKDVTWKMTGKQGMVLDYVCMQATTTYQDSIPVTAWFTPQIPVSSGPEGYGNLPGMILKMDIDNGKITLEASKVLSELTEKDAFEAPKKGKQMTQAEFREMAKAKRAEMRSMGGGRFGR